MSSTPGNGPRNSQKKQGERDAVVDDADGSSSDDSFSSDSDDEFLTSKRRGGQQDGGTVDREALVRKKLLENFYGKSAFDNENVDKDDDDDDDSSEDDDGHDGGGGGRQKHSDGFRGGSGGRSSSSTNDLDSPNFDAVRHTELHVLNDNVHPMLELEESLAGQVRTLDSTMQTLVYENYSRFIEATDAIRSIGVNVQANQSNLQKLNTSVSSVAETARLIELHCGPLRDEFVEKIRVKRLLQRLDSLLKLPDTLRTSIGSGKYRWATKSYLTAYSILSKHSAGFESLQRIESECYEIMLVMLADVKSKLVHWSGINTNLMTANSSSDEEDGHHEGQGADDPVPVATGADNEDGDDDVDPPDPPKGVSEIFECAGTPTLIIDHQIIKQQQVQKKTSASSEGSPPGIDRATSMVEFDAGLTVQECKDMSLNACLRLIERFLDTHHIELQDYLLSMTTGDHHQSSSTFGASATTAVAADGTTTALLQAGASQGVVTVASTGQLIPTNVLDSILEAAALYSMTFPSIDTGVSDQLSQFVSTAFHSFLQHVRGELLELSIQAYPKDLKRLLEKADSFDESEAGDTVDFDGSNNASVFDGAADGAVNAEDDIQDSDEKAHEQIYAATKLLLESVRQLSSGLSLPEIAVSTDLAANLVDQTETLTEALVKQKVDQKFYTLRIHIIEDCLTPFCRKCLLESKDVAGDVSAKGDDRRLQMVQMATAALSDSMQLVDDTVRSILGSTNNSAGQSSHSSTSDDTVMLKAAVEQSTKRFADWMAEAMESMVGCESSDLNHVVNAFPDPSDGRMTAEDIQKVLTMVGTLSSLPEDVTGEGDRDGLTKIVEHCMARMLAEISTTGSVSTRSDFMLAVGEMCRQAERTVMEDISASIAAHTGTSNKQKTTKSGLFATALGNAVGRSQSPTSERFRLSASRVLNMYAMNRGFEAAKRLCSTLPDLAQEDEVTISGPREGVWSALVVVKEVSMECGEIFGSPKRAGPVPETLEDEYPSLMATRQLQGLRSGLISDVERLFTEEVVVYPNSYQILEPQRNAVVFLLLKIAFKALAEDARSIRFSIPGYRQLLVDLEFLKFMLPHYVVDDHLSDGSNTHSVLESLLKDAAKSAKERCDTSAMLQDPTSETNQARQFVRRFMEENSTGHDSIVRQFTIDDDSLRGKN